MSWKERYAAWLVCPRPGCTEPERVETREVIEGGTRYHCVCECGGRWAIVVLGLCPMRAEEDRIERRFQDSLDEGRFAYLYARD